MHGNPHTAVLAAFAADALALGVHWVYDTDAIAARYGRVTTLLAPELAAYHQGKQAGDLTHYGDQMLVLLRHVADSKGFDPQTFGRQWQDTMQGYGGYVDQATRQTLANLQAGRSLPDAGSSSGDLSGAARLSPLLLVYARQPDSLVRTAREQARMTHNSPLVLATAELLARSCLEVLEGAEPVEALEQAAARSMDFLLPDLVRQGLAAGGEESLGAVKRFGQSCAAQSGLPSAVQIIARHGGDLVTALEENVMAGGDSSARGMFIATLLGCRPGATIPQAWLQGLRCRDEVTQLLNLV